jgi:hypothetical protein
MPFFSGGEERARLTIGGYVPPMQRIAVIGTATVNNQNTVLRFREQSNSALAYTLTVESKPLARRGTTDKEVKNKSGSHPPFAQAVSIVLPSSVARSDRRPVTQTVEIPGSPSNVHQVLVLTIASQ